MRCACGCGEKPKLASSRFAHGHNARSKKKKVRYHEVDCGYHTPCWLWQLNTSGGRTTLEWRNGKMVSAARAYWEEVNGPIPIYAHLRRLCRQHSCVNPSHMVPTIPLEIRRTTGVAKLDQAKVAEIRRLLGTMPQRQIAERFEIAQQTVSEIATNKIWKEWEPSERP